jgi:hypothetical protein
MFPRVYDSVELFLLFSIVRWLIFDSHLRHLCVTLTMYVLVLSHVVSLLNINLWLSPVFTPHTALICS